MAPTVFKAKENLRKEMEAKSIARKKKQQRANDRSAAHGTAPAEGMGVLTMTMLGGEMCMMYLLCVRVYGTLSF